MQQAHLGLRFVDTSPVESSHLAHLRRWVTYPEQLEEARRDKEPRIPAVFKG
jgi:hypothetical protein